MDDTHDAGAPLADRRTRRRLATMQRIQQVALELFEERGYDGVSMAQIADAAGVGERSLYRYFGTKPMLLLHDEADVASLELLRERVGEQPLVDAVRAILEEITPLLSPESTDAARQRLRHVDRHPDLQAAFTAYVWELGTRFGVAVAQGRGLPDDDPASLVAGRCLVVTLATAIERWRRDPDLDLVAELNGSLDVLDHALEPLASS